MQVIHEHERLLGIYADRQASWRYRVRCTSIDAAVRLAAALIASDRLRGLAVAPELNRQLAEHDASYLVDTSLDPTELVIDWGSA